MLQPDRMSYTENPVKNRPTVKAAIYSNQPARLICIPQTMHYSGHQQTEFRFQCHKKLNYSIDNSHLKRIEQL